MAGPKRGIQNFFISVRLAIVLLSAIAFGAVLGTIIPQQEAAETFAARLHPTLLAVFEALQLFDVYHSAWFLLLLLLLAANLIACSAHRLPAAWKQFRGIHPTAGTVRIGNFPPERVAATEGPPVEQLPRLEALLRKRCGRVRRLETPGGFILVAQKGGFSRFGVFVVHLGVLLLIAGGLAGAIFGIRGHMEIAEGETSNTLSFQGGKPSQSLPFSIRCDRFTVEHYPNGAPKLFRSDLTFIQKGAADRSKASAGGSARRPGFLFARRATA